MRPYVVVFTNNTASILFDHKPRFIRSRKARFLVNPDLTHLQNTPRHFWKLERGRGVEMTPPEKRARLALLSTDPIDENGHRHLYPYHNKLLAGAALAASALAAWLRAKGVIHV
jgi:hypothetical protein